MSDRWSPDTQQSVLRAWVNAFSASRSKRRRRRAAIVQWGTMTIVFAAGVLVGFFSVVAQIPRCP